MYTNQDDTNKYIKITPPTICNKTRQRINQNNTSNCMSQDNTTNYMNYEDTKNHESKQDFQMNYSTRQPEI